MSRRLDLVAVFRYLLSRHRGEVVVDSTRVYGDLLFRKRTWSQSGPWPLEVISQARRDDSDGILRPVSSTCQLIRVCQSVQECCDSRCNNIENTG